MKYYTIFDHAEKSAVYNRNTGTLKNGFRDMEVLKFKTRKAAQQWKDNDLSEGMYENHPHTVYEIIEHINKATQGD